MNKRSPFTRQQSLAKKILASYSMRFAMMVSLTFIAATFLAGAISFVLMSQELKDRLVNDARQIAESLAVNYKANGLRELKIEIATDISSTYDHSNLYSFMDQNGKSVIGNVTLATPFTGPKLLIAGMDFAIDDNIEDLSGEEFQGYGIRVSDGWIIAARNTAWIADSREVLLQSVSWGLGLALLLSIGLAFYLARKNEERIDRLSRVLAGAAQGDLSLRYKDSHPTNDDVARVAAQVNKMLSQLSQSMESLSQVSTDVAHDLRAPLTRLRTRIEPHYLKPELPKDAREDLQKAMADMDVIVSAFDAVLRLAQIESGSVKIDMKPVDLSQLAHSMHDMLEPVAVEMGDELQLVILQSPLVIQGDQDMLSQAIVNLIENAFRHCPSGTQITVISGRDDVGVFVKICDDGPGIPKTEYEKVLRRYYRLEKSRASMGSGLGLSLVSAIVRAHNGTVALHDNAPGLCVTLCFPDLH
jgi:signal transduction histidine kinase